MSAVCVLTPLVIASWPAISAAISGAAAAMGFSMAASELYEEARPRQKKVETELENSEVVADAMSAGEKIVIRKGDITIEFGRDERGRCTVCVTGTKQSDKELRKIGEEVAGRVIQQFTYNKLVSELKKRNYKVAQEEVLADESVKLRIRL
ncbi:MAG TPA: hypothetical protein VMV94_04975 [Phycisphaerae bacterium]|nr:hypothetical protein [Phycisphaerae bacterium]